MGWVGLGWMRCDCCLVGCTGTGCWGRVVSHWPQGGCGGVVVGVKWCVWVNARLYLRLLLGVQGSCCYRSGCCFWAVAPCGVIAACGVVALRLLLRACGCSSLCSCCFQVVVTCAAVAPRVVGSPVWLLLPCAVVAPRATVSLRLLLLVWLSPRLRPLLCVWLLLSGCCSIFSCI